MSSNTLELIAKFKDNASQGLRRLMNETERSAAAQGRAWAQSSRQRQQAINAYQRLGIRSEQQIRREMQLTQAAYNRLARSGTLSQRELARAAEANRQNIRRLNSELRSSSGQMGRWQRMMRGGGRAFDAVTRGGAALVAGGYVLAQPVRRTMDYDTELRHVTNVAYAGKSMAEREAGMASINRTVMDAAYAGAATREDTLGAYSTMLSIGAVDGVTAQRLLPEIMKAATASNTSPEEVATFVSKAVELGVKESDVSELLDRAVQSGKDGGFEFTNMVRWMPQLLSQMKAGGTPLTMDNISSLLSKSQIAFMAAGSPDEAGNNMANLLAKLTSPDTINRAKRITINGEKGFDFTRAMNKRQAEGMNSMDAIIDIAREIVDKDPRSRALMAQIQAAEGDEAKMQLLENQKALVDSTAIGQLVADRQALMALTPLITNRSKEAELMAGQKNASGVIQQDFDFLMQGSGMQAKRAGVSASRAEYDAFKGVSDKIGSGMDALGRWTKQNPDQAQVATGAGWMAAAAAAARGVFSFMPGGSLLGFGGGSATGGGGAAGGTAGGLATGSLAMASLPLIGFGGATYLAGRRDKYGEWSEGLQGFGRWLDKYLPSFRGDSKGEWLKSRIGQSPDAAQAYQDYLRGQGHTPLDSPELRMSAEQLQEAAQRMENSGEQYVQAVSDNQQAAAQFLEASRLMGTAAGQLAAAARQPVPVTVSVSGGNITAAVSQAAERDNRRN